MATSGILSPLCARFLRPASSGLRTSIQRNHPSLSSLRQLSSVINLSNEDAVKKFRTINSKSILYFTANWCPPCKQIKPIYEEMSTEHTSVAFGKVDVDENSEAAQEFEITSVPTFVLFKDEKQMSRFSGADVNQLKSTIQDLESM